MTLRTLSLCALLLCMQLIWGSSRAVAQTPPPYFTYHAATFSQQQSYFNTYAAAGYRMISLCVYGDPSDPRYAAVWVKRSGPAWVTVFKDSSTDYQNFVNTWVAKGFRVTMVSATGSGSSAVFAAVMEQSSVPGWYARHNLVSGSNADSSTIQYWMKYAQDNGYIPISVTRYSDSGSPRYAGAWVYNTKNIQWNWADNNDAGGYQNWFNAIAKMSYHPAMAAISSDQTYLSVSRDDRIGPWYAVHNLTFSDYQNAFNTWSAAGYYPIWVQGGGSGSSARYAALFAKQEAAIARQWTVSGPTALSAPTDTAKFDNAMKSFMQYHGIRSGQLAIAQAGKIIFSHAYSWAEPGYPVQQTYSPMRLASCTKMFACAAIQKLYDADPTLKDKKVFQLLGIQSKALAWQTVDSRINDVTVQECVDHTGGWDTDISHFDPGFSIRKIAIDLGLSGPATMWDVAKYMYGMPLQHDPGTENHYSNFGYMLLGLVVEKVSGMTFDDFVAQKVLAVDNISGIYPAHTNKALPLANEGLYEDHDVGLSTLDPTSNTLEPYAYGGSFYMEGTVSAGGFAATASSMAQFINKHAVWGLGGRAPGYARSGGMPGTSSLSVSRTDLADYVFIFNTRNFHAGVADPMGDMMTTLNGLLDTITPPVVSITGPSSLVGGTSGIGTVNFAWPAPAAGAKVTLTSSNTLAATVPASTTSAPWATFANFLITTYPQTSNATSTLKATYGSTSKTKSITVTAPVPQSLALSSTSVYGGKSLTGTVTLNGVTAADTVVTLSSTNPAAHTPASVTVPQGATTATFTITTDPVAANTAGSITATLNGVSKAVTLTVKAPVLAGVFLSPNTVVGGNTVTGTVKLTSVAAVDTVVSLTNNTPNALLQNGTNSDTVTVHAGSQSATFTMTTTPTAVTVKGTVKAVLGAVAKSATLTVTP